MPVSEGFIRFVVDQLDGCGPVAPRRMFGGAGLYAGDTFFAIISDDVLYLKTDQKTRKRFERAKMAAFRPFPNRSGSMTYYAVPLAVLESAAELNIWAREAIGVARRAKRR
jgi:DNA transformation protein and related proteins